MRILPLISFAGCFSPEPSSGPESVLAAAWEEMDHTYGNFELRDVDWDAAWDTWSPIVGPDTTDDDLWEALTGMLAPTDDGHVQLIAPGRDLWFANTVYREGIGEDRFDLAVIRDGYLSAVAEEEGALWGTLADGTPYVHFAFVASNARAMQDVLDAHPDARDLVVDLRHNAGGDFTWAFQAWDVLTDEARPVFRSRTRNGPDRDAFTDWETWSFEPGGDHRAVRVVLLTDRRTISAGERAARALQALPDTVTLGERTNGSFATMIGRELPNRWGLALPVQEVREPFGEASWEGVGAPVDEWIENDPDDVAAGVDAVLDRALGIVSSR